MVDDDWEDRHDWEPVDLDVTGDPQLDQQFYQSPKQRGGTGFTSQDGERLARSRAERERDAAKRRAERAAVQAQLEAQREEMRQRTAERRGEPAADRLAPHVEQAVQRGAVGRAAGWYRVDVAADGCAQWSKVNQPGDGPWITATTPAPQWQPVQPRPARRWWQRRPVELDQPSPGTQIW
jgi:hypothetical protein